MAEQPLLPVAPAGERAILLPQIVRPLVVLQQVLSVMQELVCLAVQPTSIEHTLQIAQAQVILRPHPLLQVLVFFQMALPVQPEASVSQGTVTQIMMVTDMHHPAEPEPVVPVRSYQVQTAMIAMRQHIQVRLHTMHSTGVTGALTIIVTV